MLNFRGARGNSSSSKIGVTVGSGKSLIGLKKCYFLKRNSFHKAKSVAVKKVTVSLGKTCYLFKSNGFITQKVLPFQK